ncbi:hypothetical protein ACFVH9_35620, partial [Streptomyces hirsutus]
MGVLELVRRSWVPGDRVGPRPPGARDRFRAPRGSSPRAAGGRPSSAPAPAPADGPPAAAAAARHPQDSPEAPARPDP